MAVNPEDVTMNVGGYTFSYDGYDIIKVDKVIKAGIESYRIYLTDIIIEQLKNFNIGVNKLEWSAPTEETAFSLARGKAAAVANSVTALRSSRQNLSNL